MIAYASRLVKVHEKNYTTRDLKLVVLVFWLDIWRDYLYGVHMDMFIDYLSLQCMLTQKDLVKEVHQLARLGVRLVDTPSGGVSVHSSSES